VNGRLAPCSRKELIRKLKALGYDGPFSGGKPQFMAAPGKPPMRIPNPHQGSIGVGLLAKILRDAGVGHDDWHKA